MGNQTLVPSQIQSVESYLQELKTHVQFKQSLGSTTFMKTAKVTLVEPDENDSGGGGGGGGTDTVAGDDQQPAPPRLTQLQLLRQRLQRLREDQQPVVVKVFPRYDLSIRLDLYSKRVREIKNTIYSRYGTSTNCLPFYELLITEKAAFLLRQYVKYSLYDRLSTRPFLTSIEKRWIAFQLLCAVNEIHSLQIVHGDMKTENILVNSFLWVSLADLASYKPVYLSKNHPSADFNYYFDISRRRTCCLAPERLEPSTMRSNASSEMVVEEMMPPDPNDFSSAMDIFSLGCVLAELFMERPLFDFAQLLAFRDRKYDPAPELRQEVGNQDVLEMIFSMLSLDPAERKSANEYLQEQSERAFPSYFVNLKNYMSRFISARLSADEVVLKLKTDLPILLRNFKLEADDEPATKPNNDTFLILLSLLLSCVRKVKLAENKFVAIDLMTTFSKFLDDSIVLDRVLPYYLCLLDDNSAPRDCLKTSMVKSHVIYALNDCLSGVCNIDVRNMNIFPELIFDCLERASKDESYLVRAAVAKTISSFATTSLRYLEATHSVRSSYFMVNFGGKPANPTPDADAPPLAANIKKSYIDHYSYEREYEHYQMRVTDIVMHLITEISQTTSNASNAVKEALIRSDIAKLCTFFSRQKTSEFLLPHMITMLNEKTDWSVRAAFFDALCTVLSCIGWESVEIVKPLLEQGLRDSEEFVIYRTLLSLAQMAGIGLLDKQQICYFLSAHVAPLLCHPSLWIRQGAVHFVCTVCRQPRQLTAADVLCSVAPTLAKFLSRSDLVSFEQPELLFRCLKRPIPRAVYDCIAQDARSDQLFVYLAQRSEIRCLNIFNNQNYLPGYIDCADPSVQELFDRLGRLGFVEEDEDQVLHMKDFMDKTRASRLSSSLHNQASEMSVLAPSLRDGFISIMRDKFQRCNVELLAAKMSPMGADQLAPLSADHQRKSQADSHLNTEWSLMFGQNRAIEPSSDESSKLKSRNSVRGSPNEPPTLPRGPLARKLPDCTLEVERFLDRSKMLFEDHRTKHNRVSRPKDSINSSLSSNHISLSGRWRPRGHLVFHSNEHTRGIDRLSRNSDATYFSTLSTADGCVKIWSTESLLTAKSGFYKSVFTYDRQSHDQQAGGPFRPVCTSFFNKHSLAILCDDYRFYVIDFNSERTQFRLSSYERMFRANACKSFINNQSNSVGFNRTSFFYLNRSLRPNVPSRCSNRSCCCPSNYPVEMIRIDDTSPSWTLAATNYYEYFRSSPVRGLFAYSTSTGDVSCVDLRSRSRAFELRRDLRRGYVTAMVTDPWYTWLAMGTSNGAVEVYDFRFMVPVQTFEHRLRTSVARLCTHPTAADRLVAAYQGNNEMCVWAMDSPKEPELVFWGVQSVPPLCQNKMSNAYISGLVAVSSGEDTSGLICASSDMKLRYVDLIEPARDSYVVSSAFNFQHNPKVSNDIAPKPEFASSVLSNSTSYEIKKIEGTNVLLEMDASQQTGSAVGPVTQPVHSNTNSPALIHQSYFTHHQDAITDLVVCYSPSANRNQPLMVTAARDGTLKIWR